MQIDIEWVNAQWAHCSSGNRLKIYEEKKIVCANVPGDRNSLNNDQAQNHYNQHQTPASCLSANAYLLPILAVIYVTTNTEKQIYNFNTNTQPFCDVAIISIGQAGKQQVTFQKGFCGISCIYIGRKIYGRGWFVRCVCLSLSLYQNEMLFAVAYTQSRNRPFIYLNATQTQPNGEIYTSNFVHEAFVWISYDLEWLWCELRQKRAREK